MRSYRAGVRMTKTILPALVLIISACGGASGSSSPNVRTSGADVSSLARYATYTLAEAESAPTGYTPAPARPELLARIRQQVDAELRKKGYTPAANGELVVRISTGRRTIEEQPSGRSAA